MASHARSQESSFQRPSQHIRPFLADRCLLPLDRPVFGSLSRDAVPRNESSPRTDPAHSPFEMSSTITMRPMHIAPLGVMPERLYMIPEHASPSSRPSTRPSTAPRPSTAGSSAPTYPGYPRLQPPFLDRHESAAPTPLPKTLKRPRRLTRASSGPPLTSQSCEDLSAAVLRSGSAALVSAHGLKSRSASSVGRTSVPRHDAELASLPGAILDVIFAMLKEVHLGERSESCATCWMRDLCSLSLSASGLTRPARRALYGDIRLDGPDSAARKKRLKTVHCPRMELLRRVLRANPDLAGLVRSLKLPQPDVFVGPPDVKGAPSMDKYDESVAALVMACPNLERLHGPVLSFDGPFKGILHALATRSNLRDIHWLFKSQQQSCKGEAAEHQTPARLLHPDTAFVQQHRNWTRLSTLAVHCEPGPAPMPNDLFTTTLTTLPALQHLHLSGLPANVFDDASLLSLPRLKTLSLSNIPGISSKGLSLFATRPNSLTLRKLHLRHTPLTSLPTVARMLSHLTQLVSFSLEQSFAPLMPESDEFVLCMMPYLASSSVTKLHWAIACPADRATTADKILAKSIEEGGFPALGTLRAPNDPSGVLQALCRPVERADLPTDRFRSLGTSHVSPDSAPTSPTRHLLAKSPTATSLPALATWAPPTCTNLVTARLAAQARIERARDAPRFRIQVDDENGGVVEALAVGGFMGSAGSRIDYCLMPDAGSADERGGLVDVTDVLLDGGEAALDGCDGSWNCRGAAAAGDRQVRERWSHTKRGRWTRVTLDQGAS